MENALEPSDRSPLIEVDELYTHFRTDEGIVQAVDGVSFAVNPRQTLGLVGESGCGKSVTALSILRIVPPPGRIVKGSILWHGREGEAVDIVQLDAKSQQMRNIRGNEIAMIFQEPMTSLNPVLTVGFQIQEVVALHQKVGMKEAKKRAIEMLAKVGFPNPDQRVDDYPHQLSGGLRQRAMIAMALSCNPSLLIADEPTTALDVTVQAQILELIRELQKELAMSIIMITHNLGVISEMADMVAVMYLGQIVEYAAVNNVLESPKHPYTPPLLRSIPVLGSKVKERLNPIEGLVPTPIDLKAGCRFFPRCRERLPKCEKEDPPYGAIETDHQVRCWLYEKRYCDAK